MWLSNCIEDEFAVGDAISIQYIASDVDISLIQDCTYADGFCDYAFASMDRIG